MHYSNKKTQKRKKQAMLRKLYSFEEIFALGNSLQPVIDSRQYGNSGIHTNPPTTLHMERDRGQILLQMSER